MGFSYIKLFELLTKKGMNLESLRLATGVSSATIAKLAKKQTVNMEVLGKFCKVLHCNIDDIVEYVHQMQEKE